MKMLKIVKRLKVRRVKSPHNTSSFLIQQHSLLQFSIQPTTNYEEQIELGGSMIDLIAITNDPAEEQKVVVTPLKHNYRR